MIKGFVPAWEDPITRFLDGKGELQLNGPDGPATTIWEFFLHTPENKYPLVVGSQEFRREQLKDSIIREWGSMKSRIEKSGPAGSVQKLMESIPELSEPWRWDG